MRLLPLSRITVFVVLLLAFPIAHAEEPGVSHELAIARAARVSDLRYRLSFSIAANDTVLSGSEMVTFTNAGSGDLAIDFRDGTLIAATLNSRPIATTLLNGHLTLPAAGLHQGSNQLHIDFKANSAAAGKAITRYHDKDDGLDYLYTLFVPMDADMAFPCFDQPDLKARFTLTVDVPSGWTVIGNTTAHRSSGTVGHSSVAFDETRPISTYLFAFAAGPFEALPGAAPGEPTLYVRRSQLTRAKAEAPQVQQMAARGIRYLSDYFAQPFPFPKYDLVLIPGFPFGGMEHAGATFLNEDGVLFRTAPTATDYFRRNILVLHETCHQWFGDLVTMRWFDDLWLKEGFAQYMAYKALAELEPEQLPWKHFYEEIKPSAYGIDETQGTTPIFQDIPNLKDAKSAYGAIVYQKAPSVLKQLNFFLGEETFRDGLRLYLRDHAYANAQWSDLIGAFEAAGKADHHPRDVQAWARAWILQRGMPEVTAEFTCRSGRLEVIHLKQHDVLGTGLLWPISNEVYLRFLARPTSLKPFDLPVYEADPIRVEWNRAAVDVESPHLACPAYIYLNYGDQAYGRFLLGAVSGATVARDVVAPDNTPKNSPADPLLRSMLWGALWDNVHVAHSAPSSYVDLVLKDLPTETDESLARIEGAHATTALHAYLSDAGRAAYAPRLETIAADRMMHAPTLGLRIVSFRTFNAIAETPSALAQQKALLAGTLSIPGMPLKPLDRWNILGHLIAQNDSDAAALFTAEKAKDRSGEGQKYAYAVEAGTPSAEAKARYFADYLADPATPGAKQEDWLTQSLGPFNSWNEAAWTEPYLSRALDALPQIKQRRKIFFLGAWLGSFVGGQHSAEAQAAVHDWLARNRIDPDLRIKVLEVSDALDRTVAIRHTFPE